MGVRKKNVFFSFFLFQVFYYVWVLIIRFLGVAFTAELNSIDLQADLMG